MSNKDEKARFKRFDIVYWNDKKGIVHRISDQAVHVQYDDGMFHKFHFLPVHHMQTDISELKLKP